MFRRIRTSEQPLDIVSTIPYTWKYEIDHTGSPRSAGGHEEHVEAFKALAHLSRLQIFFMLVRAKTEMSVGEIQAEMEIPGPTLSHHLDALRRAGLLESRKEERYIYYSVRRER